MGGGGSCLSFTAIRGNKSLWVLPGRKQKTRAGEEREGLQRGRRKVHMVERDQISLTPVLSVSG